jgi:hypothetical protein
MQRFARDLHVYTRVAGWLFFDGLSRADSMTFQASGAEECKFYEDQSTCPFMLNDSLYACPCEWNDPYGYACYEYNQTSPRYLQHRWYEVPSSDADEFGDRYSTSFPNIDYSPETTNWWNDTTKMPGSDRGASAGGYRTSYDRIRVVSALSVADFPLYNYFPGKGAAKVLGTYVGFEADGTLTGFSGCNSNAGVPFFQSTDDNGAYLVNNTLCPKGRFGYDCRCRGWYRGGVEEKGHAHFTAPYAFSTSDIVAMSAAQLLIDPETGHHAGMTLMDFIPEAFIRTINASNTAIGQGGSGFPVLITPRPDVSSALDSSRLCHVDICLLTCSALKTMQVLGYDTRKSDDTFTWHGDIGCKPTVSLCVLHSGRTRTRGAREQCCDG